MLWFAIIVQPSTLIVFNFEHILVQHRMSAISEKELNLLGLNYCLTQIIKIKFYSQTFYFNDPFCFLLENSLMSVILVLFKSHITVTHSPVVPLFLERFKAHSAWI